MNELIKLLSIVTLFFCSLSILLLVVWMIQEMRRGL